MSNKPIILEPNEDGVYVAEGSMDGTPPPTKKFFKSAGRFIISACVLAGVVLLAMMFVKGGVWVSQKVYPALSILSAVAMFVTVFFLAPLTAFKPTRAFGGIGMFAVSYLFGLGLWVWCLILTFKFWGIFAVILGLFIAGVGIVPIGLLATLFNGQWSILFQLLLMMAFVPICRAFGVYMVARAARERLRG